MPAAASAEEGGISPGLKIVPDARFVSVGAVQEQTAYYKLDGRCKSISTFRPSRSTVSAGE